ncbi:MAG: ATP-binding protein [Oscillospiraceae bacterium]|nr:ATP-binding protein [Oscillospiraceae bacterium]
MKRIFLIVLSAAILLGAVFLFSGCAERHEQGIWFDSYRDIPGITEAQIQAIGQLRERYGYFMYGMVQNDEAVYTRDGGIVGFSARMSEWVAELFGIPFIPVIYETITDLLDSFDNGTVHFTGQFPRIPVLEARFAMTDPISKRSVAIARVPGSRPFSEIEQERDLHILFSRGSALHNVLRDNGALRNFEYTHMDTPEEAAELLLRGEADAYISDGVLTVSIAFPGFRVEPFYPFVFGYASFSALNPELIPIVDAVQKILDSGGMSILAQLYAEGKEDVNRHRMSLLLTEQGREFIANNPVIPIAAHGFSYPISFYSEWEREFQGIAHDILRQIESITGIRFEIVRPDVSNLNGIHQLLRNGEVYLATGAFRLETMGDESFLLSDGFFSDSYTLLSRVGTPIIGVNEVLYMRVGLIGYGIFDTMFHTMFPNHISTVRFNNQDDVLDALEAGDIDLAFTSLRGLLRATHLLERTEFRTNLIFDESYYLSFAISENMPLLVSIIDKALSVVDIGVITNYWMGRTFDFTVRELRAQRPWLIGTAVLLICLLILSFALYRINSRKVAMEHAEESNRAKTRFLARMSHEIRTPIASVLGISEIQLHNPEMPDYAEEAFSKIYDSAKLLLGIVNDLLDFSKIDSGKVFVAEVEYSVAGMVVEEMQLHMENLAQKNISFRMQVDENLPTHLMGDPLRVRQIMSNLLSNAVKYTMSGSVTLSLSCEPVQEGIKSLIISVRDTGLGMSKNQIEALSSGMDYLRFHEKESPSVSGTGLGIPIVSSLLEMMGGSINVESDIGKGTHITVRIPHRVSGDDVLGAEEAFNLQNLKLSEWSAVKKFKFAPELMPYGKVLVVDDLEANLYVAQGLLSFYGLQIDTCDSGHAAIELINQGNVYDIVFMDHLMPELTGTDAMRMLRDQGYTAPIVVLTANALIGQAEEYIAAGFDDFISKPIQTMYLDAILTKFIRDKQSPEVLASIKSLAAADIENYQSSSDVQDKLRSEFLKSRRNVFQEISQALSSGDIEKAHRLFHNLKAHAGLISENELMRLAGEMEDLLSVGKKPSENQLQAVSKELIRVLEGIDAARKAPALATQMDLDNDSVESLLSRLVAMLDSNDAACLNMVDELAAIPGTDLLVEQIEECDFPSAAKTLSGLLESRRG